MSELARILHDYLAANTRIRKQATVNHYHRSLRFFEQYLARPASLADLTDDSLAGFLVWSLRQGLTEQTANQRLKQLRAMHTWCAKRGLVPSFPTVANLVTPEALPEAWTLDEVGRLLEACKRQPGFIGPHRASDWWLSLHLTIWDTGERIGCVLQWARPMVDLTTGMCRIPAKIRKGGQKSMVYHLRPPTLDVLRVMSHAPTDTGLIWDSPFASVQSVYRRYRKVVADAGLPWEPRKTGFNKIRRSVYTQIEMAGGDALAVSRHSSRRVLEESYLDAAMIASAHIPTHAPLPGSPGHKRGWAKRLLNSIIGLTKLS